MSSKTQGCGGTGKVSVRIADQHGPAIHRAPCPGCPDCQKCNVCDATDPADRRVIIGVPCVSKFHDKQKCGTCGGSGWIFTQCEPGVTASKSSPCPDCTPKPPDTCPCLDLDNQQFKCRDDSGYMCDCRWKIAHKQKRRPMEREESLYTCHWYGHEPKPPASSEEAQIQHIYALARHADKHTACDSSRCERDSLCMLIADLRDEAIKAIRGRP